jgi:nucleoside-diphosphate-sugar epimerase
MRVLITGICGLRDPRSLAGFRESAAGIDVFGIDNLMRPGSESNRRFGRLGIKVLHGDIRNRTDVEGIFSFWVHTWRSKRPLRYIGFGGKGYQVRDALHPDDLAEVILRQLRYSSEDREPLCNLAGGIEMPCRSSS